MIILWINDLSDPSWVQWIDGTVKVIVMYNDQSKPKD